MLTYCTLTDGLLHCAAQDALRIVMLSMMISVELLQQNITCRITDTQVGCIALSLCSSRISLDSRQERETKIHQWPCHIKDVVRVVRYLARPTAVLTSGPLRVGPKQRAFVV